MTVRRTPVPLPRKNAVARCPNVRNATARSPPADRGPKHRHPRSSSEKDHRIPGRFRIFRRSWIIPRASSTQRSSAGSDGRDLNPISETRAKRARSPQRQLPGTVVNPCARKAFLSKNGVSYSSTHGTMEIKSRPKDTEAASRRALSSEIPGRVPTGGRLRTTVPVGWQVAAADQRNASISSSYQGGSAITTLPPSRGGARPTEDHTESPQPRLADELPSQLHLFSPRERPCLTVPFGADRLKLPWWVHPVTLRCRPGKQLLPRVPTASGPWLQ